MPEYDRAGPAQTMDQQDELAGFKSRFHTRDDQLYFDGNSLGLMARDAEVEVLHALDQWRTLGIDGWLSAEPPWFQYGERLGALMAPLVGAGPGTVVLTGSTTVNLHTLVLTFLTQRCRSGVLLADSLNFPSDLYALASCAALTGREMRMVESSDGRLLAVEDIMRAIKPDVGLVVLPSVLYRSGQLIDIAEVTRVAHSRGTLVGFDCSHSVGVVPHKFDEWGVDFAFWCSYKYLNGGPGATGALYVNRRHWDLTPALTGWWGNSKATQFDMSLAYDKAEGAGAYQIGTPNILGSAALLGALRVISDAGIDRIRKKSLQQTDYLISLIEDRLVPVGFSVGTPLEHRHRGGHVALIHDDAWRISVAMKERGVIPDFRPPDVIRLCPSPLYTSYMDIFSSVETIRDIMESGEHLRVNTKRQAVT